MSVLTLDDINNNFPDNRYKLPIIHNPDKWKMISIAMLPNPIKVKFDINVITSLPTSIADSKGIYMFFLEPSHPFLPELRHLLYIGRVKEGKTSFSFKKRMYDYKSIIGDVNNPLNRVLLTNLWPDYTFVYFYNLDNMTDQSIEDIEQNLFENIVPPLNSRIGGKTEQTRNLY